LFTAETSGTKLKTIHPNMELSKECLNKLMYPHSLALCCWKWAKRFRMEFNRLLVNCPPDSTDTSREDRYHWQTNGNEFITQIETFSNRTPFRRDREGDGSGRWRSRSHSERVFMLIRRQRWPLTK
jgi:hypothetical protein